MDIIPLLIVGIPAATFVGCVLYALIVLRENK